MEKKIMGNVKVMPLNKIAKIDFNSKKVKADFDKIEHENSEILKSIKRII